MCEAYEEYAKWIPTSHSNPKFVIQSYAYSPALAGRIDWVNNSPIMNFIEPATNDDAKTTQHPFCELSQKKTN